MRPTRTGANGIVHACKSDATATASPPTLQIDSPPPPPKMGLISRSPETRWEEKKESDIKEDSHSVLPSKGSPRSPCDVAEDATPIRRTN